MLTTLVLKKYFRDTGWGLGKSYKDGRGYVHYIPICSAYQKVVCLDAGNHAWRQIGVTVIDLYILAYNSRQYSWHFSKNCAHCIVHSCFLTTHEQPYKTVFTIDKKTSWCWLQLLFLSWASRETKQANRHLFFKKLLVLESMRLESGATEPWKVSLDKYILIRKQEVVCSGLSC